MFDFDKTIYDGDSTVDFYFFSLRRNILLIKYLPIQIYGFLMYRLRIKNKEYFKEKFFSFLKGIKDIDNEVENFWIKNKIKIKEWLITDKENMVIISASPEFLLSYICKKLKVLDLIATKVNKNSGKFESLNCFGKEKVERLNKLYLDYVITEFYSDSKSDEYLAQISKLSYLVDKENIVLWK